MISFIHPCFKWKLLNAIKPHYGWTGLASPFQNRYLTQFQSFKSETFYNGASTGSSLVSETWNIDRLTGIITAQPPYSPGTLPTPLDIGLPGLVRGSLSQTIGGPDPADPLAPYNTYQITVSDDSFTSVVSKFYPTITAGPSEVDTTTIQLSNLYSLGQLEQDADALIAGVSWDVVPWMDQWNLVVPNSAPGDYTALMPAAAGFPGPTGAQATVIPLVSAAWSVYAPPTPSTNGTGYDPCPIFYKMTGLIALAGNYCQETFLVDLNANPLSQSCQSGSGSCAAPSQVWPPAGITIGQNSYVQIVPDCQC